jgi:hypothetical protein
MLNSIQQKQQKQKPQPQPQQPQQQKPLQQLQQQKPLQQLQQQKPQQQKVKIQQPKTEQLQQLAKQILHQHIKEKTSHKQKKQVRQTSTSISTPTSLRNKKVIFKLKNNQVDKFYSPQMVLTKLTKTRPIDLESIQDLPEIPLDEVFRTQ